MKRIVSLLAIALWSSLGASAEVRLPKILSSHMVLQRDRAMHFWGGRTRGEGDHYARRAERRLGSGQAGQMEFVSAGACGGRPIYGECEGDE